MTKLHKKLLVIFCAIVCTLCLCLGVTACKDKGEHTHTFDGFWLFDGAEGHYRLAACHPEVKSELEPHVDENGDLKCDFCDFVMHVHVDGDGDNVCDDCEQVIHRHEFTDEWTFNEIKHWHEATCEHFLERDSYVSHAFTDGVCECGVKESEVKVYNLYTNSPEYELYFVQWLDWLESEGITVEYTESGDGVYHFADGHSEVRFIGTRTLKVKAESDGEPLADVWFMVTLYANKEYFQKNGTIALGIAKTDETGVAEIAFSPVGGYSSATVEYRIRIAEKKDIAVLQGVTEEKASLPFPNRCQVSASNGGFEYKPYTVAEEVSDDEIAATVEFKYSKGWNAYNTIELPYKRYYEDLINGTGVKEEGAFYGFTTSGNDLFDYFIFEPAKYSFASGNTIEDFEKIEENAKQAASGIYKISFTYTGNAHVTMYYWNELGVNLGAYHRTNADGTPSDDYITAISGGTAGDGKYTGGNYADVIVLPKKGLRQFQFGIISDESVRINVIVERLDDFVIGSNDPITVGDNENIILQGNGAKVALKLRDVPSGYYNLTIDVLDGGAKKSNTFIASVADKEVTLWDGISEIKGIINIPEGADTLYITNNYGDDDSLLKVTLILSPYEGAMLWLDEEISVPVSGVKDIKQEIRLDASITGGMYKFKLTVAGDQTISGAYSYLRVDVGDETYSISLPLGTNMNGEVSVTAYIRINQGDTLSLYVLRKGGGNSNYPLFYGKIKVQAIPAVEQDVTVSAELSRGADTLNEYAFTATRAGTYTMSITQTNDPEFYSDDWGYTTLTALGISNSLTGEEIKKGTISCEKDPDSFVTTATVTFTLEADEVIVLYFRNHQSSNHLNIQFVIEYVEN